MPSLQSIPLRWGGIPTLLLASGAFEGVVVSEHGHLIDRFGFPVRLNRLVEGNGEGWQYQGC